LSFHIEIKGLEELQRTLEELQEGLTLPTLNRWCKKIESQAKISCPQEYRETIQLTAVRVGANKFDIEFKASKGALSSIKQAIRANLHLMPLTTKALFEVLLKNIEQQ
jgi:hypothetical protein